MTVKLRSGAAPGRPRGLRPRPPPGRGGGRRRDRLPPARAATQHKGRPDYALARELVDRDRRPGDHLRRPRQRRGGARTPIEESGADAVMIARGSLGNPWIFEELTGPRATPPSREEVIAELLWVMDRAEEHLGPERAARYLRKFYPWYLERLGRRQATTAAFQESDDLDEARRLVVRSCGRARPRPVRPERCRELPRQRLARSRQGRGVPRPPHPRLRPRRRRPAPAAPARLSLQLVRLAVPARAGDRARRLAPDFLGFGLSEKPRDHDYTLHWQADMVEELARREGPDEPCSRRPRHGDVGRQRADGARHRGLARDGLRRGRCCSTGRWSRTRRARRSGSGSCGARLGRLFSRLSSERFFRQQFGSIFSPGHPLTDEEAEDQWELICAGGGRTLNHKTIAYMEERFKHAERWHGALATGRSRCRSPGGCSTRSPPSRSWTPSSRCAPRHR